MLKIKFVVNDSIFLIAYPLYPWLVYILVILGPDVQIKARFTRVYVCRFVTLDLRNSSKRLGCRLNSTTISFFSLIIVPKVL